VSQVSTLLSVVDPRAHNPFGPASDTPDRDELLESFLGVRLRDPSVLLVAVAVLSGDDVLRHRVRREISDRAHPLPRWLANLDAAVAEQQAFELTHVLGDGHNLLVAAPPPGGRSLTAPVGASFCAPGPRRCWPWTSSTSTAR
jgi:hypothetical protein